MYGQFFPVIPNNATHTVGLSVCPSAPEREIERPDLIQDMFLVSQHHLHCRLPLAIAATQKTSITARLHYQPGTQYFSKNC